MILQKGVDKVGLTMLVYGVCDTFGSYVFGYIIKYTGRAPIFVFAATTNMISIAIMIFWTPSVEGAYVFFLIAALWGLSDAV